MQTRLSSAWLPSGEPRRLPNRRKLTEGPNRARCRDRSEPLDTADSCTKRKRGGQQRPRTHCHGIPQQPPADHWASEASQNRTSLTRILLERACMVLMRQPWRQLPQLQMVNFHANWPRSMRSRRNTNWAFVTRGDCAIVWTRGCHSSPDNTACCPGCRSTATHTCRSRRPDGQCPRTTPARHCSCHRALRSNWIAFCRNKGNSLRMRMLNESKMDSTSVRSRCFYSRQQGR